MANMTANRLTVSEDFRGRGFAIAAEDASGLAALDAACDALRQGTLDLAIVAAADFATETVTASHMTARPADLAAALVLKRRKDAETAGDPILGTVTDIDWTAASSPPTPGLIQAAYGSAPVADALFGLAARLALAARGLAPAATETIAAPCLADPVPSFSVSASTASATITPAPVRPSPDMLRPTPHLFWAAAASRATLAKKLAAGKPGGTGKHRIALLAPDADKLRALSDTAAAALTADTAPEGDGIFYGAGDPEGELAFAFTGSAASYPRMGRGLLAAFPEVASSLSAIPAAQAMTPLLAKSSLTEFEQLCAVSLLTQAHTILLRDVLGLQPSAALGLSLGESNA
ncbi:MAG: hypothetical protein B7Z22_14250, partial [Hyphomonas sp. 32-62-5]